MVLLWAAQVASAGLLDGGVSRGCAVRGRREGSSSGCFPSPSRGGIIAPGRG